jgi:hypothetical protein
MRRAFARRRAQCTSRHPTSSRRTAPGGRATFERVIVSSRRSGSRVAFRTFRTRHRALRVRVRCSAAFRSLFCRRMLAGGPTVGRYVFTRGRVNYRFTTATTAALTAAQTRSCCCRRRRCRRRRAADERSIDRGKKCRCTAMTTAAAPREPNWSSLFDKMARSFFVGPCGARARMRGFS